jgi:hypothetical protein
MWRITHTCGHDQEHYIIGEYAADYDRRAAVLSRRTCDRCWGRSAALTVAAEHAATSGLIPAGLYGSAKQIAWTETIRAKCLSRVQQYDHQAAASLASVSEAKWWIERRSEPDAGLIAAVSELSVPALSQELKPAIRSRA